MRTCRSPAVKVPTNTTSRADWLMLMKPPAPASRGAELADVEVALGVGLRQAEDRDIEAAAVVEVELARLVDDRLRVDRRAEVQAARPGCRRSRRARRSASAGRTPFPRPRRSATPSGMPMPRLTTALRFSSSAARRAMILRAPIGHRRERCHRHADLAGERRRCTASTKVCMWCSGRSATTTQSTSTPGTFTWRGLSEPRSAMPLDLRDDDAAAVVRRHRDRQRLERQRLALHRQVAVGVGGGARG